MTDPPRKPDLLTWPDGGPLFGPVPPSSLDGAPKLDDPEFHAATGRALIRLRERDKRNDPQ